MKCSSFGNFRVSGLSFRFLLNLVIISFKVQDTEVTKTTMIVCNEYKQLLDDLDEKLFMFCDRSEARKLGTIIQVL